MNSQTLIYDSTNGGVEVQDMIVLKLICKQANKFAVPFQIIIWE